MNDGVTIDANVMKTFEADFLAEVDTASRAVVELSLLRIGLVVDVGEKIRHEWFQQCQSLFFKTWFLENLKTGHIRFVQPMIEPHHKKNLTLNLGFPARGYDVTYVAVANATRTRYIVTDDIDFFEPKAKSAPGPTKEKIKHTRNGSVCNYLRKKMKITVGTTGHAQVDLLGIPESEHI